MVWAKLLIFGLQPTLNKRNASRLTSLAPCFFFYYLAPSQKANYVR